MNMAYSNSSQIPMYNFEKTNRPQSLASIDYNYDHAQQLPEEEDTFLFRKSEQEKALVRRIDLFILPLVCLIDFIQFLDKSTINYAAAFSFKEDLHITPHEYNILGSIFYLGYLVYQLPNNYFLQRVSISKYLSAIIFIWGAILIGMAFGKNFRDMIVYRFFLGVFEAGVYPSLTLLVSTFYRRSEQAFRLGAFWLCNGFALMFGGLIAYGIGNIDNSVLKTWQWIMLIMGIATCVLGVVCFLFLIDSPKSPRLGLNAEQSVLVEYRAQDNAVFRTTTVNMDQIKEALREVRLWALCFAVFFLSIQNGGITIYNSQLIITFGFNQLQSVLLSAGSGITDIFYIVVSVFLVTRKEGRLLYTGMGMMAMNLLGFLLLLFIPQPKLKLIGYYLTWPCAATFVLILTCITNNVSGYTKKIFYNSMIIVFYTIGNFAGPFLMVESQKPTYYGGMIAYCCSSVCCIFCLAITRWTMARANRSKPRMKREYKENNDDLTDVQDQSFFYLL
ncbi:major facilitator superfamily domain-containing protein [Cunninghamella echinulata]|nr:major facilitator superfamily domain-containing protein [Cunninghamella echinulata]